MRRLCALVVNNFFFFFLMFFIWCIFFQEAVLSQISLSLSLSLSLPSSLFLLFVFCYCSWCLMFLFDSVVGDASELASAWVVALVKECIACCFCRLSCCCCCCCICSHLPSSVLLRCWAMVVSSLLPPPLVEGLFLGSFGFFRPPPPADPYPSCYLPTYLSRTYQNGAEKERPCFF